LYPAGYNRLHALGFLNLTPAPRRSLGDELDAGLTERAR
jgi:hypothetical protein